MPDQIDPLARIKPLSDPVRVITLLAAATAVIVGILAGVPFVFIFGIYGALVGLAIALFGVSFAMLLGPAGKPNAVYLRAFRTDRATAKLRAELAAILGPGFRLSGIRPPRRKTSVFLRFLAPQLVALRYAGSKFMELEAGDDWMARLWRTYQTTRLVFVDVRDITIHVHREIQMTMATMGAERCIFVVDQTKSIEEWRAMITSIAGPQCDPSRLQLLDASGERIGTRQLQADLNALLDCLPAGEPGETDRGRQFVLENVSEDLLKKSQRISPMNLISAVVALAVSLGFGYVLGQHKQFLLPIAILGFVVTGWVVPRALARAGRFARAGHRAAATRTALLAGVASLPCLIFIFVTTVAIPAINSMKIRADEVSAINSIRAITSAETEYESTYGANGYACDLKTLGGVPGLEMATPTSAQLLDNDLASSGCKSGYLFKISNCEKVTVNGTDRITGYVLTAVPASPGKTGNRGFCTDQFGGNPKYDPTGGSNCTEELQ